MEKTIYNLKITFTEPILGTQPQKDVAMEYLQDKARSKGIDVADENETLPEIIEKGTTVFHKLDGKPIYYDYHVKGFLKESAQVQNGLKVGSTEVKQLRSKIDNNVFVEPRRIVLNVPDGGKIEYLERPLRAMTAQGPRVSLARSEMLPEGTTLECRIVVLDTAKSREQITEPIIRALLDYGKYKGFGQWRNASYGRIKYELFKLEDAAA